MDMNMLNKMLTISIHLNSFKCKIKLKRGMLVEGKKAKGNCHTDILSS